jgi:WD40 repeat protein
MATPAGMVSCLAFTPDGGSLAAGTYSSSIGIFDPRIPELQMLLQGHKGGLTQVRGVGWCGKCDSCDSCDPS